MEPQASTLTEVQLSRRTHAGKVWLTAGMPVVTQAGSFEVRGFIQESCLAPASRWAKLNGLEQARLERTVMNEAWVALTQALSEAARVVQAYVYSCSQEDLGVDQVSLAGYWSSGEMNLDKCEEELASLLTEQRSLRRQSEMAANIARSVKLADYPGLFEAAGRKRKLIAVLGPTNSGKTHDAFCRLAEAKSGLYLGPLRLLALEAYSRLNQEFNLPTSLVTGEERRIVEGSTVLASTIEMLDTSRAVEVAVIDEVQMLSDPDRGWAWTQAVVGANADEVWLLGALSAEPALRALAKRLSLPLEVRYKSRKHPLKVSNALAAHPAAALTQAAPGDAFIVFSRRDALNLRDDLLAQKKTVACIYGALSPEVREKEAHRFASGEAEVLVATDAIGLGLNLPIQRVIFTSVHKFDGVERSELPAALLQQIGGRAGRYGHTGACGLVAGVTPAEHAAVVRLMAEKQPLLPIKGFAIAAGPGYLQAMTSLTGETRLEALLSYFERHVDQGDGFFRPHVPEEQLKRAGELDGLVGLDLADKLTFSMAPMPSQSETMDKVWRQWARQASKGLPVQVNFLGSQPRLADLEEAEDAVRLLSAYRWFSYRMPEVFVDQEKASQALPLWIAVVDAHLKSKYQQGQGGGKKGMPSWYWGPPGR